MNNGIGITPQQVKQEAQELLKLSQTLREILTNAGAKMKTLNNVYQSEKANEILQKFNNLSTKFETFSNEIGEYSQFLTNSADTYLKVESATESGTSYMAN